jgi:GNAT superfamily N-acetyltransferase
LLRALGFERAMHAAHGRVVTAAWGQAFLDPTLQRCHERNLVWAIDDAGGVDAATLDAAAERLLGGAGLLHRRIVADEAADARLRDGLVALGYGAARHVFLAFGAGAPPPPPSATGIAVVEVDAEALTAPNAHYLLTDPDTAYGRDDRTRAELVEHHRTYAAGGPATERIFAVLHGDSPVAWARLWTADGVAQVEDVVCLAEHRGHGYGRAVVAAATRAALAGGPELTFIVADEDDWPKDLYGRLGFAPVGRLGVYLRLVAARG